MSLPSGIGKRAAAGVLVAAFVVLAAMAAGNLMTPPSAVPDGPTHEEWSASELDTGRLEAAETPDPGGDVGTVVFDQTQTNRFNREDIEPLVDAINRAGGSVRVPRGRLGVDTILQGADVLVIIDPANEYSTGEMQAIQQFVANGGRLVVFGEPNRHVVQQTQLVAQLATQRSFLTTVGSTFGISFDTSYLYDQENNDGNFKNVLVGPPDDVDHALVEGVDQVAMYTATSVSADGGTVLLRTAPTAERTDNSRDDGFPVAVVNDDNSVLAIGDKSFLQPQRASVADNEDFIARIVEFMAGANHQPGGGNGGAGGNGDDGGDPGDGGNGDDAGNTSNGDGGGNASLADTVFPSAETLLASSAESVGPVAPDGVSLTLAARAAQGR